MLVGLITTRHLVTHAVTIVKEFGIIAYIRCWAAAIFSRHEATFLELVVRL